MKTRYRIIAAIFGVTLLTVALWAFLRREPQDLYRVTILPTLGGDMTMPTAINNSGQVVGHAEAADGTCHLFLWDRETGMQDLGPAREDVFALLYISDAGQIAGTTEDAGGNLLAFLWDRARGMQTLGTLGGRQSAAMGLNNRGQVVGWSETPAGSKHAFVWDEPVGMRDLGTLGGKESVADAVNDSGMIVGKSDTAEGRRNCPVLWTVTESGILAYQVRDLFGSLSVNNRGCIVGRQRSFGEAVSVVLWHKDAGVTELFRIDRPTEAGPLINDANQILFKEEQWTISKTLFPARSEYYLWDPNRGRIPLDRYVPTQRDVTLGLLDLNDNGCMVGWLWGPGLSYARGVLLEPIPERWQKQ